MNNQSVYWQGPSFQDIPMFDDIYNTHACVHTILDYTRGICGIICSMFLRYSFAIFFVIICTSLGFTVCLEIEYTVSPTLQVKYGTVCTKMIL